jgi:hypothetical protein
MVSIDRPVAPDMADIPSDHYMESSDLHTTDSSASCSALDSIYSNTKVCINKEKVMALCKYNLA